MDRHLKICELMDVDCGVEDGGSYESQQTRCHVALWRAVIMQAMLDITTKSSRTEDQIASYHAKIWFMEDSEDFRMVCCMADYSHVYVRNKALELIGYGSRANMRGGVSDVNGRAVIRF